MNHFIPDDKLAAVRICSTTATELVKSLGQPNGQARDGDMATMNWSSAAVATQGDQTAIGTQMVCAWIDTDGLVAGFVVNPPGLPQKPLPCREQHPDGEPEPPPTEQAPVKQKTDA